MNGHQGQQVEWRLGWAAVAPAHVRSLGRAELAGLFSPLERAHSGGRHLEGLAGRLAAKYAMADVLGQRPPRPGLLRTIQVLPSPRLACRDPAQCDRGHPPAVGFEPGPAVAGSEGLIWIEVSIAHEAEQAFAAVLAGFATPALNGPGAW
jgi:hypothetical protein